MLFFPAVLPLLTFQSLKHSNISDFISLGVKSWRFKGKKGNFQAIQGLSQDFKAGQRQRGKWMVNIEIRMIKCIRCVCGILGRK